MTLFSFLCDLKGGPNEALDEIEGLIADSYAKESINLALHDSNYDDDFAEDLLRYMQSGDHLNEYQNHPEINE
jgi:hypothetical protein